MYPYLIDWTLGETHIRIPTYGFLLALAFTLGYFESIRRAIKLNENPKHVENLFLIVVASSVVGARLFHVFFEEWDYYSQYPWKILSLWEGGYTFYGAMLLATFFVFFYAIKKKLNYMQYADIAAFVTAFGLFLGRLGCFFAGCCWGKPSDVPWAVTFSNPHAFSAIRNISVHPTQLYESFGALLIFIYLAWRFERRKYPGQVFFHGLLFYCILRFLVEFFRGDEYRGYVLAETISYSQFISLMLIPFILLGMFCFSRFKKENQ